MNVMKSNKAININNEVISQCHPGNGMYVQQMLAFVLMTLEMFQASCSILDL